MPALHSVFVKRAFLVKQLARAWWEGLTWSVGAWFCSYFLFKLCHWHRHNPVPLNRLNLSGKTLFNYSQTALAHHSQVCLQASESSKAQIKVSALLLSRTGPQRGQSTCGRVENVRAKASQSFLPMSSQDTGLHAHQALMKIGPKEKIRGMASKRTDSVFLHNLIYWRGLWLGSQASNCFWTHWLAVWFIIFCFLIVQCE